jgi:hypothetical protein
MVGEVYQHVGGAGSSRSETDGLGQLSRGLAKGRAVKQIAYGPLDDGRARFAVHRKSRTERLDAPGEERLIGGRVG